MAEPSIVWTLGAMPNGPLVPPWLALPLAGVVVLVLGAHMHAMARADMPASRRRIRTATGWLMLITAPLTGYAFGVASPTDPRQFVLVWLSVAGLLAIIILLACIDILNTRRLQRGQIAEMARQVRRLQASLQRQAGGAPAPEPATDGDPLP